MTLDLSTSTLEVDELNIAEAAWQLDRCADDGARSRWAAAWGRWLIKAALEPSVDDNEELEKAEAELTDLEEKHAALRDGIENAIKIGDGDHADAETALDATITALEALL